MANPFYLGDIRKMEASRSALTGRMPSGDMYDRLIQNELAMRYQGNATKEALATETALRQQGLDLQKQQMENQKSQATGNLILQGPLYAMGAARLGKEAGVGDLAKWGYNKLFGKPAMYDPEGTSTANTLLPSSQQALPTAGTSPALTGYESMEGSMEAANAGNMALPTSSASLGYTSGMGYGAGAGGAGITGAGAGGPGIYGAGAGYEAAAGMSSGAATTGMEAGAMTGMGAAGPVLAAIGWGGYQMSRQRDFFGGSTWTDTGQNPFVSYGKYEIPPDYKGLPGSEEFAKQAESSPMYNPEWLKQQYESYYGIKAPTTGHVTSSQTQPLVEALWKIPAVAAEKQRIDTLEKQFLTKASAARDNPFGYTSTRVINDLMTYGGG